MKVLNLYAGIGGNRKLWTDCEVTAVEIDREIAAVYRSLYPDDIVIVGDAHAYLQEHFSKYDFIWSSPPCQSHSRARFSLGTKTRNNITPIYPDGRLWEEILFLQYNAVSTWIVENVNPYYETFIQPTFKLGRHLYWSNMNVTPRAVRVLDLENSNFTKLCKDFEIDARLFDGWGSMRKRQVLRNCVLPEIGLHIYRHAQAQHRNESITTGTIEDFL